MPDSAEHIFITEAFDASLRKFSETRLLGLREADRRRFDYGCLLLRDFTRPLVSQVLWSHAEGIEKDIRTLVFDAASSLRLYFVRDHVRNRAKIDDVLKSYRDQAELRPKLRGLRIIPVPEGFDADSEQNRNWLTSYIHETVSRDLLFGVVFGKLQMQDVTVFCQHGGLVGLKIAALELINRAGLSHNPTFEKALGTKGSPLREAIAMLTGTGLILSPDGSMCRVPSLKGRFLLDLARRLMLDWSRHASWSEELRLIMAHLGLSEPEMVETIDTKAALSHPVWNILYSIAGAKRQFGLDIMEGVKADDPELFADLNWRYFSSPSFNPMGAHFAWRDGEDLPDPQQNSQMA